MLATVYHIYTLSRLSTTITSSKIQYKECSDLALNMHAEMMLVDEQTAYVGSQNFTAASLKHNREVGLVFSAQESPDFNKLIQTFQLDWSGTVQSQS